jgi:hypothetical protein
VANFEEGAEINVLDGDPYSEGNEAWISLSALGKSLRNRQLVLQPPPQRRIRPKWLGLSRQSVRQPTGGCSTLRAVREL